MPQHEARRPFFLFDTLRGSPDYVWQHRNEEGEERAEWYLFGKQNIGRRDLTNLIAPAQLSDWRPTVIYRVVTKIMSTAEDAFAAVEAGTHIQLVVGDQPAFECPLMPLHPQDVAASRDPHIRTYSTYLEDELHVPARQNFMARVMMTRAAREALGEKSIFRVYIEGAYRMFYEKED